MLCRGARGTRSLGLSLAIVVWLTAAWAGTAEAPMEPEVVDSRQVITRLGGEYLLFLGPDRIPLEMQKDPVLRWPNPTRDVPEGFYWQPSRQAETGDLPAVWT